MYSIQCQCSDFFVSHPCPFKVSIRFWNQTNVLSVKLFVSHRGPLNHPVKWILQQLSMDPIWPKMCNKSNFYYVKLSVSHPGPLNHPMNASPLLLPQFQFGSNLATNEVSGLNIAEISRGSSVIISMNAALIVHGFSCSSILATFEEFEQLKFSCTYEAKNIL